MKNVQRIAKLISSAGICSRRDAEKKILEGHVKVNNKTILVPAFNVSINDIVEFDNKIIARTSPIRAWLYYKPVGLITTHKDPQNRPTVFEQLKNLPRVISVGRLDLNSEGLLLLTNNRELALKFEHPTNNFERRYKVRAYGKYNLNHLKQIVNGIRIKNIYYQPKSIEVISSSNSNSWFEIVLAEGKNREIRKIFQYFNLEVNRLIRTNYGPFSLGKLKVGQYNEISADKFRKFL